MDAAIRSGNQKKESFKGSFLVNDFKKITTISLN